MSPNQARKKVKSGCRTCKIRKVKCDEGRPSCHRCISTGRNCDGYGIWGGGGNANTGAGKANPVPQHRYGGQPPATKWIPRDQDLSLTSARMSNAERGCYAWFFSKTSMKFSGIFCAPFWRRLVPQACFAEPAILHATLALSAMHQRGVLGEPPPPPPPPKGVRVVAADEDDGERFALQQYSRAIAELQPHLRTGGAASVRVALITCLVFAALEFVRGRRRTGLAHLRSGLRLLGEAHGDPATPRGGGGGGGSSRCLAPRPARGFVDEWIVDVFGKLLVQVRLHGPHGGGGGGGGTAPAPRLVLPVRDPGRRFGSVLDARQHLDELLNGILDLAEACRRDPAPADGKTTAGRLAAQRDLRRRLDAWRRAYEASDTTMQGTSQVMTSWGYALLLLHWDMARIMAGTCLRPDDESVFDEHDEGFLAIVDHTVGLWRLFHSGHSRALDPMAQWDSKASKVTIDTGWVPPLYFLALKCRVPGIRQHAIRCLEYPQHTEGLWDTELASCIGKEVIRLEGGHEDVEPAGHDGDTWLDRVPIKLDLAAPRPPRSRRLHGLQVTLPEGPAGQIAMEFQQCVGEDTVLVPRTRVYEMTSRSWVDSV